MATIDCTCNFLLKMKLDSNVDLLRYGTSKIVFATSQTLQSIFMKLYHFTTKAIMFIIEKCG